MEKIFIAGDSIDLKIIGRSFPQVTDSDTEQLFKENGKRIHEDRFEIIPPDGFSVKITKSVKLTDNLSSFMVPHSPIVSEKFVEFIKNFTMPSFKLIPIKIYRLKELVTEKKYFIIHFLGNDILNVNFKKSTFDYYTGGAGVYLDRSILQFHDYENYLDKAKKDDRIYMSCIQKVVMKSTLKNDLFFLDNLEGSATFVSQKIKEAMEKENISGFSFKEVGYIED